MEKILLFKNYFIFSGKNSYIHIQKTHRLPICLGWLFLMFFLWYVVDGYYMAIKMQLFASIIFVAGYFLYWFSKVKNGFKRMLLIFYRYWKRQFIWRRCKIRNKYFFIPVIIKFRIIKNTIIAISIAYLLLQLNFYLASIGVTKIVYMTDENKIDLFYILISVTVQQWLLFILPSILFKRIVNRWILAPFLIFNFARIHGFYPDEWTHFLTGILGITSVYLVLWKKDFVAANIQHAIIGSYALMVCLV